MADFLKTAWTRLKLFCGSSRTIAFAYLLEVAAVADELKFVDWSSLFGAEKGGRIAGALGLAVILLRLITRAPVQFSKDA